jgi:hypothetical protein
MLLALLMIAAQTMATPDDSDLRCFAITSAMVSKAPPEAQPGIAAGMMYFMGRVEGRSPSLDLETAVRRVVPSLADAAFFQAEAQRCASILQERGAYLQKMGKSEPAK